MKKQKKLYVYKSLGTPELFSKKKLFNSLKRAGLPKQKCNKIADQISANLTEGTNTKDIYKHTLRLVKKESAVAAAQYSLKKAIFELGPTGYHFEEFVAKYFEHKNFKTITSVVLKGKFVKHEVDVIATQGFDKHFVECKFHNRVGIKNDVKITLYVKARWDDLRHGPNGKNIKNFYVASNTSYSLDALTYAKGVNLKLLGLNAPSEYPFIEEIKDLKLYPLTSLIKLNKFQKNALLEQGVILVQELIDNPTHLSNLGMTELEVEIVLNEASTLLGG